MNMITVDFKAVPQQGINPKGDCGPCCMAGIIGVPVAKIYEMLGRIDGMTYFCMVDLCQKLQTEGFISEWDNKLLEKAEWESEPWVNTFGRPAWMNCFPWTNHVSAKLHSGWVGLAMVNMRGQALTDNMTANHWVLIVGCKNGENKSDKMLKISCPTLGDYEKNAYEFLMHYGGYNTIWVKL